MMKMIKTIMVALLFAGPLLVADLPHPEQPESLGLHQVGSSYKYGTLVQGGGQIWAATCTHFYPLIGRTLTFGNGSTAVVEDIVFVRGGYYADPQEAELAFCKLDRVPENVTPSKVLWRKPSNLEEINGSIEITGFGLDGLFHGDLGEFYDRSNNELYNGFFFRCLPPAVLRPGYSGSPLWDKNWNLIAANWGGRWATDENGNPTSPSYGAGSAIYMVLEKFAGNFPAFAHEPLEPKVTIQRMSDGATLKVTLKAPGGSLLDIVSSADMKSWSKAESDPSFIGFEESPGPWEQTAYFSTQGVPRNFFSAEEKALAPRAARAMVFEQPAEDFPFGLDSSEFVPVPGDRE